jgi:predicted metal-dependent hydrolase
VTLDIDGRAVEVTVRASSRAVRFVLRLGRGADATVLTVPETAPPAEALAFLDRHTGWLAERLAQRPRGRPFRPGESLPIRGVEHRLVHRAERRGGVRCETDAAGAAVVVVAGGIEHFARRVHDLLVRLARADLAAAAARHAETLGVEVGRIRIKDTRSRWGSCTAAGDLSFSWRVILAPPTVLDYLAAHEVAHLREMNHSIRFWRLVAATGVEVEASRRWLKRHGAELHAWGVETDDAAPAR